MRSAGMLFALLLGLPAQAADDGGQIRIRAGPYPFPQSTISVQADLVETAVTVRNRRGAPVPGLTAADFVLLDNGRPQQIAFFSQQTVPRLPAPRLLPSLPRPLQAPPPGAPAAAPRSLALFFDDTHAAAYDCRKAVQAAQKLLDSLDPADRVALYTASGSVTLDYTTGRAQLRAALARIAPHWSRRPPASSNSPGMCRTPPAVPGTFINKVPPSSSMSCAPS